MVIQKEITKLCITMLSQENAAENIRSLIGEIHYWKDT